MSAMSDNTQSNDHRNASVLEALRRIFMRSATRYARLMSALLMTLATSPGAKRGNRIHPTIQMNHRSTLLALSPQQRVLARIRTLIRPIVWRVRS